MSHKAREALSHLGIEQLTHDKDNYIFVSLILIHSGLFSTSEEILQSYFMKQKTGIMDSAQEVDDQEK